MARYDAAGALRFAVPFDTGAADCAMDITVTAQGDIVTLVGSGMDGSCYSATYEYQLSLGNNPHGLDRFSLRRVSADGVAGQESPLCDPCSTFAVGPLAVATGAAGAVYIAGSFSETSTIAGNDMTAIGDEDVLVMKLGAAGAPVWIKRFGSPGTLGNATDVIVDAQGGIVVAGRFLGELPIGPTTHQSTSGNDIFLARLDPATGNPTWSRSFANANVIAPRASRRRATAS